MATEAWCSQDPCHGIRNPVQWDRPPRRRIQDVWTRRRLGRCITLWAFYLWTPWNVAEGDPILTASIRLRSEIQTEQRRSRLRDQKQIAKTAFSSKLRLVFYVGLEGTGHHFAGESFHNFYTKHEVFEVGSCEIAQDLVVQNAMLTTAKHYSELREKVRVEMRKLAKIERNLEPPGTIVTVQLTAPAQKDCPGGRVGQLSYPDFGPPNKVFKYPDAEMLAEIAEEEGVDFRILYLQRAAQALLVSNIIHRDFVSKIQTKTSGRGANEARFMKYIQILLLNAAAIQSSLDELGPGFVTCFRYEDMDNEDQAARVARFLSPTESLAGYLQDSLLATARSQNSSDERLGYRMEEVVVNRLQRKLDAIDVTHCSA